MKREMYTIDVIEIGDEILLDDTYKIEHNLFWKVIHKISHMKVMVEIRDMGYAGKFLVNIQHITAIQRFGRTI